MDNISAKEWVFIIVWILLFFLFSSLGVFLAIVIASVISFGGLFIYNLFFDSKANAATGHEAKKPTSPTSVPAHNGFDPNSSGVTVLVDETIDVVNEIFDIAGIAHFLSDIDYSGVVQVLPYAVRNTNNEYRIKICMHEVSELEQCRQKNIRWKDNPDNHSKNAKIYGFAWKYRNNYDPTRHCYEIDTRATVRLAKNELPMLEAHIKEQIMKRCEMAKYSGSVLYHKGIYDINN